MAKINKHYNRQYNSCKRKVRYRTEGEALKALHKCKQKRDAELDYYYCEFCNGFHLTKRMDFLWNGEKIES